MCGARSRPWYRPPAARARHRSALPLEEFAHFERAAVGGERLQIEALLEHAVGADVYDVAIAGLVSG